MKKLHKLFLLLLFCTISIQSFAQEKGQFNASATYVFGAGIASSGGMNFGVEYFLTPKIAANPSYTHYFSEGINYGEFNIDARYYFLWGHIQLYGLLGYANLNANGNFPIFGDVDESESGVNLGAGIYFPTANRLFFIAQIKYSSPLDGQVYYQAGIAYRFNK